MAKKQTRRSVSVDRVLYNALTAFAERHGIPAAQVASQGIRAILNGRLKLEPASNRAPTVAGPRPPDPNVVRMIEGFCASCTGDLDTRMQFAPWGKDDAPVRICFDCQTRNDPTNGNISLGGGVRTGFASGCKWTSSRGGER